MKGSPKIVMCGCTEGGWETVNSLLESGFSFDYFVSLTPEKADKVGVSGYRSFEDLSKKYSIPIYYVEKYSLNSQQDRAFFDSNNFDLLIQGGWQRLFPEYVLQTLSIGAIGVHGSSEFLPKGRGRSPINWSLIEGKKRFILHFFLIQPGIDDGAIFHYEIFDVNAWDDCRTLYYKTSIITTKVILEWVPKLVSGSYVLLPQQGEPTYYRKRTPDDGKIDWNKSVFDIYNFIRALTHPYPGAFSYIRGKRVVIWKAQPFDTRIAYPGLREGEIIKVFASDDVLVNCNSGLLLITEYNSIERLKARDVFSINTDENIIPAE